VPADEGSGTLDVAAFIAAFHRLHEAVYTYAVPEEPVEVVSVRLRAVGSVPKPSLRSGSPAASSVQRSEKTRQAWFGDQMHETRILRRESLAAGDAVTGPAIIQELSSATVLPPGAQARVDEHLNLIITLPSRN
jgi:N-methylhydantoinase A